MGLGGHAAGELVVPEAGGRAGPGERGGPLAPQLTDARPTGGSGGPRPGDWEPPGVGRRLGEVSVTRCCSGTRCDLPWQVSRGVAGEQGRRRRVFPRERGPSSLPTSIPAERPRETVIYVWGEAREISCTMYLSLPSQTLRLPSPREYIFPSPL